MDRAEECTSPGPPLDPPLNPQAPATPQQAVAAARERQRERALGGEMPCPVCGHLMPDLKGGRETICLSCGFKDSCCY
jgi:hypothetical protein